ncbi:MAG: CpsD/CapB family tyrosine-protein kinase [Clostridia bacterium]|nr:CpsD/CapB family tyrosine-protein kinase [Clostridia bacterium]
MEKDKSPIRLGDIIYSIFDGKWIIIGMIIVGLLAGVLVSAANYVRGEMSKQYKIEASVLVTSKTQEGTFLSKGDTPSRDDITLAKELTDQTMYIMKSDRTVLATIERLGMIGVSARSIQNNLTLSQYNDTQIIEISFLWRSRDEGISILKALEETTDDTMLNTLMVGNVTSVNEPKAVYIFGGRFDVSTWIYFALGGFLVGVAVCVIRRMLFPTLIWPETIGEYYGLEVFEDFRLDPQFGAADPFHIEPDDMDTAVASAAYIILNRMEINDFKSIYFTSSGRKEGRTKLLADLAVKISETGKKVLLIDCDFSNPSLAPLFGVNAEYDKSLNALYKGETDSSDVIHRLTGTLSLVPYLLEDKADHLNEAMLEVIRSLMGNFDLVMIDAAPVGEESEVLRLNDITDACLFVVRYDGPKMLEIDNALTRLHKSDIPVIGALVNCTKSLRDVLFEVNKKRGLRIGKDGDGTKRKFLRRSKKKKEIVVDKIGE